MTAVLRLADLDTDGRWGEVAAGPDLEQRYRAVTGWRGATAPVGLASVIGRLAYTRGRPMPPGGVLREIGQRTVGTPPADGRWQARVAHTVLGERSGRRRVAVTTDLRCTATGRDVATVRFVLDWPAGAA
jgi:hypothetical protein